MPTSGYWLSIYQNREAQSKVLQGFYNMNYLIVRPDQPKVVIRVPVPSRDQMEPRTLHEASTLRAARQFGINVPEVVWVSNTPEFQVHEFMVGELLADRWPAGEILPESFIVNVVQTMQMLESVPRVTLEALERPSLSDTASSAEFLQQLLTWETRVLEQNRSKLPTMYKRLGISEDPFVYVRSRMGNLQERKFRLCHGDLQRLNCLISEDGLVFLDWELALWADPMWDLASHLHRMRYTDWQERQFLSLAQDRFEPSTADTMTTDLPIFAAFESIKSVVNDSYRYAAAIAIDGDDGRTAYFAQELKWKLDFASSYCATEVATTDNLYDTLSLAASILRSEKQR